MWRFEHSLPILSLTLFVASSLQAHEFRCVDALLDECAYTNDPGFDRITHPWMTPVTNNFESIRTPSNSQRPLTVELTAIFLSTTMQVQKWVLGRGWRGCCLRRPARVEGGDTFNGWRENGALAPGLTRAHLESKWHASQEIRSVVGSYHGSFYSQLGSGSIFLLVGCHRRRSTVQL